MPTESDVHGSGSPRLEKLTPLLVIGLLVVQTAVLGLLVVRVNSLQQLLLTGSPDGSAGSAGGQGGAEVVDVEPGDGPSKGSPDAPVTIVEFSCFTCPACADLQPDLKRTLERFPDQVRLTFRYFPLRLDGKPVVLAKAAECARAQGRFWEAHDVLFRSSEALDDEAQVVAALTPLGLEPAELSACLASDDTEARVRADFEAGRSYGVTGTPTLFVNGRRVQGADFATLTRIVESSLEKEVI